MNLLMKGGLRIAAIKLSKIFILAIFRLDRNILVPINVMAPPVKPKDDVDYGVNLMAVDLRTFVCGLLSLWHIASYSALAPEKIFPVVSNALTPSKLWLNNSKPLPTNAWFTNFIINNNQRWSAPVNIFPYLIKVGLPGVGLSYTGPISYKDPAYPNIISALYYQYTEQLVLGCTESMDNYGVENYHGLRVNMVWNNPLGAQIKAPIFQGSPYFTEYFIKATPKILSSFKWLSLNQQAQMQSIEPTSRYEIKLALDHKNTQTWIVYSEKPIKLTWSTSTLGEQLVATEPYTGWIRLVLQSDTAQGIENNVSVLDAYASAIPLDYKQTYYTHAKQLIYTLAWQTSNNKPPLMLTLPHQRTTLTENNIPIKYSGIKGMMQGITQSNWGIILPLIPIKFLATKSFSNEQEKSIRSALAAETKLLLQTPFPDEGPYLSGKRYARAARLLLIANALHESGIQKQLIEHLESLLTVKMLGKTKWSFEYDKTWGGIIPSIDNYGARHYNDHHYHYGYWVYTFAVLAHLDKRWLDNPLKDKAFTPKQWIEHLINDYANPGNNAFYPLQRYQDDYAGHSWASGLTSGEDGQNEQSSSEAVNAYYALALYAQALNDQQLFVWARFLMGRELRSAQTYWQITKNNAVYNSGYNKDNQVIGNLWASKIDANAFFIKCTKEYRCGLQYSFGIQMLPFTEISPYLFNQAWLSNAYPTVQKLIVGEYGAITPAWKWILIKGVYSVMNKKEKEALLQQAMKSKIEDYDNGDSKTNTIYFLANDQPN